MTSHEDGGSLTSSSSSYFDEEGGAGAATSPPDDVKEGLVENLKEALADRERRIQMEKFNNEEVIPKDEDQTPPPLPPKLRNYSSYRVPPEERSRDDHHDDDDDDEPQQTRVLDFSDGNQSSPKKRSSSKKKKPGSNAIRPGNPLYRRPELVSLHPSEGGKGGALPDAYDPLKIDGGAGGGGGALQGGADSDENDIGSLVQQANNLEMRPYPTKPDDQIEILLPSYQRQIPAHEKKNLKSVIPEVFSKLAQDQDHEDEDEMEEYNSNFNPIPQSASATPNFEAIRSATLPSPSMPRVDKMRSNDALWPSDITDFDTTTTDDDGEVDDDVKPRHRDVTDDDDAYDTVADQTDLESPAPTDRRRPYGNDNAIVCDKYQLVGQNSSNNKGNTFPKRLHQKKRGRSSIAIPLNDATRMSSHQPQRVFPNSAGSSQQPASNHRTASLGARRKSSKVEPPPLISAHKTRTSPEEEARRVSAPASPVFNIVTPAPDRVVDFFHEPVAQQPADPASLEDRNRILQEQQELILQQLRELNQLQKLQIADADPKSSGRQTAPESGEPAPTHQEDMFGPIEPIVVTAHHVVAPTVEPTAPPAQEDQAKRDVVVEVENPLEGRSLGGVEPGPPDYRQQAEPTSVTLQPLGADSGIDLTNYGGAGGAEPIPTTSSNTSSSDDEEEERRSESLRDVIQVAEESDVSSHDSLSSEQRRIQKTKEYINMKKWYKRTYMKPRCCYTCIQSIIFLINFLFFLIGAGLVGLAAYGLYDLLLDRVGDPIMVLIDPIFSMSLIGFLILLLTVCSMSGFCRGKLFLIKAFGWLLVLVCIIFFASAIVFWIYKSEFPLFLSTVVFRRLIVNYQPGEGERVVSKFTIDQIQQRFQCCGMENQQVWNLNPNYLCGNSTCPLPESCCLDLVPCNTASDSVFNTTCIDAMSHFVDENNSLIAATWGGIMLLFIIQFILTHYMIREVFYRILLRRQIKLILRDHLAQEERSSSLRKKKRKKKKKKKKPSYINPVFH